MSAEGESDQLSTIDTEAAKSRSEIAAQLFRKVSVKYPASVTAQAIAIALECQVSEQNPIELCQALVEDNDQLTGLAEMANNIHLKNKTGRKNKKFGAPTDLTADNISDIVHSDFIGANNVISFEHSELNEILNLYPRYIQPGRNDERGYSQVAEARFKAIRRGRQGKTEGARMQVKNKPLLRRVLSGKLSL